MAKKKDQEELESRVLSKVIGGGASFIDDAGAIILQGDGWSAHSFTSGVSTFMLFLNIQRFDLSGYQLQDKTLFPQAVLFQDMNRGPMSSTPPNLQRCTVVSTTPLSTDSFTSLDENTFQWNLPGTLGSTFELANILSARYQDYVTLTTLAGVQQSKESTYGSGNSTAGESLWYADAYLMPFAGNAVSLTLPDAAVVIPTTIFKEADLEYMMRLARSVEPVY